MTTPILFIRWMGMIWIEILTIEKKEVINIMNKQMENVMGTQTMRRLVLSTGVPLMMSLLISSLYNFVDSVFVSRVSEDVLAAVSLAAPAQMMISALGLGNAIGLNAVISKALGEKQPDKVRKAADASIFIGTCA